MPRNLFRSALAAVCVALSGCSIELQHDLTEDDANEIYVVLQHNGISASNMLPPQDGT